MPSKVSDSAFGGIPRLRLRPVRPRPCRGQPWNDGRRRDPAGGGRVRWRRWRRPTGRAGGYAAGPSARTTTLGPVGFDDVSLCGPGQVCVVAGDVGFNAGGLTAFELEGGTRQWMQDISGLRVATMGDRILTNAGQVFDLAGRRVSASPSSSWGLAAWVGPTRALVLLSPPAWDFVPNEVWGMSTVDGIRVHLGTLEGLAGNCAIGDRAMLCPFDAALRVYRFA